MCLLVALVRAHPDHPLIIAANRDEFLARPATAMAVLSPHGPRILGGRDEVAGGTWLATNAHGVVAGLTNMPTRTPPDSSRRTRGELPVKLARFPSAQEAAAAFIDEVDPRTYNPAWLLVGDARSLHYLDVTADRVQERALGAGVHVLENSPLGVPSPKAAHVQAQVQRALEGAPGRDELVRLLTTILADHQVPPGAEEVDGPRPPAAHAACVHAGPYGTRSSSIVLVRAEGPPTIHVAHGPPCVTPFSAVDLWSTTM